MNQFVCLKFSLSDIFSSLAQFILLITTLDRRNSSSYMQSICYQHINPNYFAISFKLPQYQNIRSVIQTETLKN